MKKLNRVITAIIAAAIIVSALRVMNAEAAGKAIDARFVTWESVRFEAVPGVKTKHYDSEVAYVGIDASAKVSEFEYILRTLDGSRGLKSGSMKGYVKRGSFKCVRIDTGRKYGATSVRIRAKINGKWSAWSKHISLIPIHTGFDIDVSGTSDAIKFTWKKSSAMKDYDFYVSETGKGGWKRMTRTTGNSYTLKSFNGAKLNKRPYYFYKVIGRAEVNGKMVEAKGNSDTYYANAVYIDSNSGKTARPLK